MHLAVLDTLILASNCSILGLMAGVTDRRKMSTPLGIRFMRLMTVCNMHVNLFCKIKDEKQKSFEFLYSLTSVKIHIKMILSILFINDVIWDISKLGASASRGLHFGPTGTFALRTMLYPLPSISLHLSFHCRLGSAQGYLSCDKAQINTNKKKNL